MTAHPTVAAKGAPEKPFSQAASAIQPARKESAKILHAKSDALNQSMSAEVFDNFALAIPKRLREDDSHAGGQQGLQQA